MYSRLLSSNFFLVVFARFSCHSPPLHIFQFFAQKKVHGSRRSNGPNFLLHVMQKTDAYSISAFAEIVYCMISQCR